MFSQAFPARPRQRLLRGAGLVMLIASLLGLGGCGGGGSTGTSGEHPASSLGTCKGSRDCVHVSLAGALNGDFSTAAPLSSFMRCTVPSGSSTVWLGDLFGDVSGRPWEMVVEVLRYDGPTSYTAAFSLSPAPASSSQAYSGNGTLTLDASAYSGTVRAVLSDPATHSKTVVVNGSFSCPSR